MPGWLWLHKFRLLFFGSLPTTLCRLTQHLLISWEQLFETIVCLPQILFYFRLSNLLSIPNRARLDSKIWSLRLTLRKTWFLALMTPGAKYPTPREIYLWIKSSLKCLTKTPKGQIDMSDLKKFDYKNTDLKEKKFREKSSLQNFSSFQSCQMRPEGQALQRGFKSKKAVSATLEFLQVKAIFETTLIIRWDWVTNFVST